SLLSSPSDSFDFFLLEWIIIMLIISPSRARAVPVREGRFGLEATEARKSQQDSINSLQWNPSLNQHKSIMELIICGIV
ncbi:hypothetical protein PENTCL1PPCAC_22987, partial [Pristionchus entomophagus]